MLEAYLASNLKHFIFISFSVFGSLRYIGPKTRLPALQTLCIILDAVDICMPKLFAVILNCLVSFK